MYFHVMDRGEEMSEVGFELPERRQIYKLA
jgi:hypothetical protein